MKLFGLTEQESKGSFLFADKIGNLIKYDEYHTGENNQYQSDWVIPAGTGICGDILMHSKTAQIVLGPNQDTRFNSWVDKDTTIPLLVFPITNYE